MEDLEQNTKRILDILLEYNIHDDLQVQMIPTSDGASAFVENFRAFLQNRRKIDNPVDLGCLIQLLQEFIPNLGNDPNSVNHDFVLELLSMLPLFHPSSKSICYLFDWLRTSARLQFKQTKDTAAGNDDEDPIHADISAVLSMEFQSYLLSKILLCIMNDDPSHIVFPGEKDSYIQVASIPWNCKSGYTVGIWLKIPSSSNNKSFEIFRCRSPQMSIDVSLSSLDEEGMYSIRVITNSEKQGRDELRGKVFVSLGTWHYLAVKHNPGSVTNESVSVVNVVLDGKIEIEGKLAYPVVGSSNETLWTFGIFFTGMIASATLYEMDLSENMLHFIYDLGPYISEVRQGVNCPQSSFDSGHVPLGSLFAKGPWGKLCKIPSAFTINALSVSSMFSLPNCKLGKQHPDVIYMIASASDTDSPLMASIGGHCIAIISESWVDRVMESGGVLLPLYLIWTYCNYRLTANITQLDESQKIKTFRISSQECLLKCIYIISSLIKKSVDAKEQFIQSHGFHVVAHSLCTLSLEEKKTVVDEVLINAVFNLVNDLGPDGVRGDGIASALQGILFDFRVWSINDLSLLKVYLEGVCGIVLKASDQFFKCVGLQRILDITKIYFVKSLMAVNSNNNNNDQSINSQSKQINASLDLAVECADEINRLLIIAKDAALSNATKSNTNITTETDALLLCLDDTNCNLLAERILRLLSNIRHTSPSSLQKSLITNRFHDTTIISLLTKKEFSLEVRSHALSQLLWLLSYELQPIPQRIHEYRKSIKFSNISTSTRARSPSLHETNRMKALHVQIKEEAKPVVKAWKNLSMLAEVVKRALEEHSWGNSNSSVAYSTEVIEEEKSQRSQKEKSNFIDIENLVVSAVLENQQCIWLLVPLLPVFLSHLSNEAIIKIFMVINVQFKTDEANCEALTAIESTVWMEIFVGFTFYGIKVIPCDPDGHSDISNQQYKIALDTCADIAIDTLCIILEYKIKYNISETGVTWEKLQRVLNSAGALQASRQLLGYEGYQVFLLRKCISLVIQRIIKTSEELWSIQMLKSINTIINLAHSKDLHRPKESIQNLPESNEVADLLDFGDTQPLYKLSSDENQLLCFILDLLNAVRRASKKNNFEGVEWLTLNIGYRLILDCLPLIGEEVADRVAEEVIGFIKKASEESAPYKEEEFLHLLSSTLFVLRDCINRLHFTSHVRLKMEEVVFSLINFFTDLRCKVALGAKVPRHVTKAMDLLRCAETFGDINLVFSVLEVMLKGTNPNIISFSESGDQYDQLSENSVNEAVYNYESTKLSPDENDKNNFTNIPDAPVDFLDDAVKIDSSAPANTIIDSSTEVVNSAAVNVAQESNPSNGAFLKWLKIRIGIVNERCDSERARLSRSLAGQELAIEATKKFWRRLRKKIESESFLESHICQWKLGVAHEGPFYGRKRIMLRPRFDNLRIQAMESSVTGLSGTAGNAEELDMTSDELDKALQRQYSGHIKDVTRTENEAGAGADKDEAAELSRNSGDAPGTGWGVIDADGSEDGFGVIGTVKNSQLLSAEHPPLDVPSVESMNKEDISNNAPSFMAPEKIGVSEVSHDQLDENFKAGKIAIETGPSHAGTYKAETGYNKLEAKVVMITASGNCWGTLTLNTEELFFRSSSVQDEALMDHAAVNAMTKLRRRRWKVSDRWLT